MEILNQTVVSSISESKQISECDVAEWKKMKQMSLIEMDGFLKGKCIPRDLKVNETNAEYLVRKFAEAEAKCAALVAENAGLKHAMAVTLEHVSVTDAGQAGVAAMVINDALHHSETPATNAFLAEIERKAIRKFINSIVS